MAGYADLIRPDSLTLRFTPFGLASRQLHPDDAVAFQSAVLANSILDDAVPGEIRSEFERLRDKHIRGVVDYSNFADVCNRATGLYEPALRWRFLEFYQGRDIPFIDRNGAAAPLRADDYDLIYRHVNATKGKYIDSGGERAWFNGTLHGLLVWARSAGLLRGQRARQFELIIMRQRNRTSHGTGHRLETPVTSAGDIRDLGEFINQLWGVPTVGGCRYPAPVTREILALGSGSNGDRSLARAQWLSDAEDPALAWVLFCGAFDDEAMGFDSRYQTSGIPSTYLWGPGTASEAMRWLDDNKPTPDGVDPIDHLLLVRHDGSRLYLPQRPEIAAAMPNSDKTGRWHLVLADHPLTAFACVRASANGEPGHDGACACATRRLAHGTWPRAMDAVTQLRPNFEAAPLPVDVRVVDEWRVPDRFVLVDRSS